MTTEAAVSFVREATLGDFSAEARDCLRTRVLDTLAAATTGFDLRTSVVVPPALAAAELADTTVGRYRTRRWGLIARRRGYH
jgi:2-methylcitrate dehydratase PrpD